MRYSPYRKTRSQSPNRIGPDKFIRIAIMATEVRNRFSPPSERLPISKVLEDEEATTPDFSIKWHEVMPDEFGDCWGCVETQMGRSVLHIVEEKYVKGHLGDWFSSHLMGHEFGHYKLGHAGVNKLAPTLKGNVRTTGSKEDPAEELEADTFSTLLLVPVTRLMSTRLDHGATAKKYGEEPKWIKKFSSMANVSSVKEPLMSIAKERGWFNANRSRVQRHYADNQRYGSSLNDNSNV